MDGAVAVCHGEQAEQSCCHHSLHDCCRLKVAHTMLVEKSVTDNVSPNLTASDGQVDTLGIPWIDRLLRQSVNAGGTSAPTGSGSTS